VRDAGIDEARSRINKGGNKLLSAFLSEDRIRDRCEALDVRRTIVRGTLIAAFAAISGSARVVAAGE